MTKTNQEIAEEAINPFIEIWCRTAAAHLLDTDDNAGQRLRDSFAQALAAKDKEREEAVRSMVKVAKSAYTDEHKDDWGVQVVYKEQMLEALKSQAEKLGMEV